LRIKCLGCEALARLVYLCAAYSPHIVDVELSRIGLHTDPDELRDHIQARIDGTSGQGYDAIVLAYGVCGRATVGLTARDIPLVIPRAHDCITLFLGSRARYDAELESCPGTYWYSVDYIERGLGTGAALSLGSGSRSDPSSAYDEYVQKYGKDNADCLMEVMGAWQQHYQRAVFIDMEIGDGTRTAQRAAEEAQQRGWSFEQIAGDLVLLRKLLAGHWQDNFLILSPGEQITMTHTVDIVASTSASSAEQYVWV